MAPEPRSSFCSPNRGSRYVANNRALVTWEHISWRDVTDRCLGSTLSKDVVKDDFSGGGSSGLLKTAAEQTAPGLVARDN